MMKIEVTERDIQAGERESYTTCPVALAINRVTGQIAEVSLSGWVILLDDNANADLPDDVIERIESYDEGGPMEPFSFDLPEYRSGWAFPNGKPDPEDADKEDDD